MPPQGGIRTSLSFSVQSRNGQQYLDTFQPANGVFSPGLPLTPPDPQPTRVFDFNVGVNSVINPRGGAHELHSFASLRAYANVEPVRLAIETCKDQVERLEWKIKTVDGKKSAGKDDSRIGELTKFFRKPDGVTPFATWLREALEDLLVIDAPAFAKQRNRGGKLIGLDVVPGSTIKLLVDENGRRPRPPIPAYQQIIKGLVWNNLTTEELIYAPRNPRPDHMYGLSPVEQIIVTINTVMRRQGVQLAYFTDSSVPAGILNAPAGWAAKDIKTMQDAWDARIEGDGTYKNKLQWVPDGTKYQAFKEAPLKDDFDEWLYRIVCYSFSLPPTAFTKQVNRATAEQSSNSGKEEGIESRKLWWKRLADDIIQEEFGYTDLEWGWSEDVEVDAHKQAEIDDLNLKNGSATINEIRDSRGQDVIDGGDEAMIYLTTGPVLVSKTVENALNPPEPPPVVVMHPPGVPGSEPPAAPKPSDQTVQSGAKGQGGKSQPHKGNDTPAEKLSKASRVLAASIDRPKARRAIAGIRKAVAPVLRKLGDETAATVDKKLKSLGKAADDGGDSRKLAEMIARSIDLSALSDIKDEVAEVLEDIFGDAGADALVKVGVTLSDELTNLVNDKAVDYAKDRAADLVSVDGEDSLVDSTRAMIRDLIVKGLEDNIGRDAIADSIQAATAFSEDRADLIAKTEVSTANEGGKLEGWKQAQSQGIALQKGWQTTNNDNCCDDCSSNEDAGLIDLDESFPSGDDSAPAHPRCQCVTYAERAAGDDQEEED